MPTKKAPAAAFVLALALIAPMFVQVIAPGAANAAGEPPLLGPFKDNFTLLEPPRPAPQAVFTDAAGQKLTLQDFEGRVVLLNFWATWCAPCVREMPDFDHLQAELSGRGLSVIAASQDRGGMPVVEQFYQQYELGTLGIYLDGTGRLAQESGVRGLPTTFLIDRAGNLVGVLEGPAEWHSPEAKALIEHYLGNPPGEILKTGG